MHSDKKYKMPCGCEFDLIENKIKDNDGMPPIQIDFSNLRNCPLVWDMLAKGNTKGVFQLETSTGEQWSAKVKAESIDEISALISIIRPGVLKSQLNGKSLAEHYTDRKNNGEHIEYISEHLEPLLSQNQGIMLYQEDCLAIAKEIAGFDLGEAETLRKAIGKKSSELMAELKPKFLEGCEKVGKVDKETAKVIFSWLEESQKYGFCKSHSVSYAKLAYATAYMKCHFPLHFFASSLYWAKEKIDEKEEIRELVYESKKFDIEIRPPSLKCFRENKFGFSIMNKKIYFGLSNVKGIGESACKNFLSSCIEIENLLNKSIDKLSWNEFLFLLSGEASKTVIKNSISVGLLDHLKIHRQKLLFDYDIWSQINDYEQKIVKSNYKKIPNIESAIEFLLNTPKTEGGPKTENRRKLLSDLKKLCDSPPFSLYDNREWISKTETELMGVTLTASMLEGSNTSNADTTCQEFNNGKTGPCSIAAVVTRVNEYVIKKGKQAGHKMGAMTIQDDTDKISSVLIFADAWEANKDKIYTGAQLVLHGQKSKQNDSFLVSKVRSI